MILLNVNNSEYYPEARVLVNAFYPYKDVRGEASEAAGIEKYINVNVNERSINVTIGDIKSAFLSPTSDRKDMFDAFKTALYDALSKDSGRTLPWGILTGIRPTKIVMGMLSGGMCDEDVRSYMKEHYKISDRKLNLTMNVAKREKELLSSISYKDGYSLYIGIPFCPTTCLYCSFTSYPIGMWKKRTDEYVDALLKEIRYVKSLYGGRGPETIYFGGGTPTTLEPYQLDRILSVLEEEFDLSGLRELTVEAGRPDSVTYDKFKVLKSHKVDRISINPQTMNQKTLDLIGRRHTTEQVKNAFNMARECGFDNINMDLIVGLPGETIDDVRYTLEEVKALAPDNLTVHSLAIKRAAALNIWKDKLKDSIINTDEIISLTAEYAGNMGLNPYYLYRQKNMAGNFENVGYARDGKEGLYNILIMEEVQTIIACGAGGSSKIVFPEENRIERIENVKDVKNYIERVDEMIERKKSFFEG